MSRLCRGTFGPGLVNIVRWRSQRQTSVNVLCQCSCSEFSTRRQYSQLTHHQGVNRSLLVTDWRRSDYQRHGGHRHIGWIPAAVRSVLKLRYLLLGGAIGGGASIARQYEEWKNNLPDTDWIKEMVPEVDINKFRSGLIDFRDNVKGKIGEINMDPKLKEVGWDKYAEFKMWFDNRLDKAIKQVEEEEEEERRKKEEAWKEQEDLKVQIKDGFDNVRKSFTGPSDLLALSFAGSGSEQELMKEKLDLLEKNNELIKSIEKLKEEKDVMLEKERKRIETDKLKYSSLSKKYDSVQEELMKSQMKYQKEIEKLEKENKELRKQLLLKADKALKVTSIKKSLIDMYSEVLDELSGYDSSYNTADQLPRVVVIGDQSSGKTSVLEMVAQARIFPRGAGEMMTRSPVKVTLSEGPYHVAQFKDSSREFDLTKESDLAALRREVEVKMMNSVKGGRTVSNDVISMTVKGPGLERMVLVDLPGIISTTTMGMNPETKDAIKNLATQYMTNPNAIILCIQVLNQKYSKL